MRKILVWVFIIGFWLVFYWYQSLPGNAPHLKKKPAQESSEMPSSKK